MSGSIASFTSEKTISDLLNMKVLRSNNAHYESRAYGFILMAGNYFGKEDVLRQRARSGKL